MDSHEACVEHKLELPDEKVVQELKTREHRVDMLQRAQWLRAAILGANDGLLSTSSLMLGVAAAKEDRSAMMLSGLAGALAGACSMAVGEFVSVATQRDIELEAMSSHSVQKSVVFVTSSPTRNSVVAPASSPAPTLSPSVATPTRNLPTVLSPVMKVIAEHTMMTTRDEEMLRTLPSPVKAAVASAMSFLCGSCIPLFSALFVINDDVRALGIAVVTSLALASFGAVGAYVGGSPMRVSAMRVLIGGWIAMAVTYGLLKPFDRDNKKAGKD